MSFFEEKKTRVAMNTSMFQERVFLDLIFHHYLSDTQSISIEWSSQTQPLQSL